MIRINETLTPRQAQLCQALDRLTGVKGYPPSVKELADDLGISVTRCHSLLRATEWKGAIASSPGIARSWRVVATPHRPRSPRVAP